MSHGTPAVLFDLDGTLVDTAEDLAAALWAACDRFKRPRPPIEAARTAIGDGGPGLIQLAFGNDAAERDDALAHLLEYYADNIARHSRVYAPLDSVLAPMDAHGTPWGIVTNKREGLAHKLLGGIGVTPPRGCIVGGDTLSVSKPDPAPLHHAAELLGADPAGCLYIGDHRRDIEAGTAAGMRCVAVSYGYICAGEDPHSWGAEAVAETPAALATIIEGFAGLADGARA